MTKRQFVEANAQRFRAALFTYSADANFKNRTAVLIALDLWAEIEKQCPEGERSMRRTSGTLNMVRPPWPIQGLGSGYIACSCGTTLQTTEAARSHWQQGHFDYAEVPT